MALTQISTSGIKDATIATADIANDAVTQAQIAGASIDEAKMNISNTGSNGQFLQKQSGNTGGLTWADASVGGTTGTDYNDSVKVRFGTDNDLEIYHTGSHGYIQNGGAGSLYIRSNNVIAFLDDSGDEMLAKFVDNGRCELYFDNSKKLETTANGISVTGRIDLSDNLDMPDSAKIILGTGDDLKIYHSGGENFIRGNASASPLYIDCCENLHIRH